MIDRQALKARAKEMFLNSYWPFVGILLIAGALGAGVASFGSSFSLSFNYDFKENISEIWPLLGRALTLLTVCTSVLGLAYTIFVGNVATVGSAKLCIKGFVGEDFHILDLFHGFRFGKYWRNVGAMALYTLFVGVGLMLFVVPGIIVGLGLSQMPYLLAEYPDLSPMDAVRSSWLMMNGRKWELFVLKLSFIGWDILSALTFGVVGAFFVNPYVSLTNAGYHVALMNAPHEA